MRHLIDTYIEALSSRRGAVFSSNYEYPGRYTLRSKTERLREVIEASLLAVTLRARKNERQITRFARRAEARGR